MPGFGGPWSSLLRSLTLPQGATSGARIVLNGETGLIEIYNAAGDLVATIGPDGNVAVFRLWDGSTIVGELASTTGPFDIALRLAVAGDSDARWYVRPDGAMFWGPGNVGADTNLYRDSADTLKTDDNLTVAGTVNIATALTGDAVGITRSVRKTADTTRVNTVAMAVDPELQLPMVPGTYDFEFDVRYAADPAPDIKFDVGQVPAGSFLGKWSAFTNGTAAVWSSVQATAGTALFQATALGVDYALLIKGTIVVTQVGTFGLRWAQNALSANGSTVYLGSNMKVHKSA